MLSFSKKNSTLDLENHKEWLETNICGSYASGTISDGHTRKYHGLLVAQLLAPYGKFVLLSTLEDYLHIGLQQYPLSTQRYQHFFADDGFVNLQSFALDLAPTWQYQCGSVMLTKTLLFLRDENTVLIKYQVNQVSVPLKLSLKPFLAYRDYHSLSKANAYIRPEGIVVPNGVTFSPYEGMPSLTICSNVSLNFSPAANWYYHLEYIEEKARGYDYLEDLFVPGVIEITLDKDIIFACTTEDYSNKNLELLWDNEMQRRMDLQTLTTVFCTDTAFLQLSLLLKSRAAEQVLVKASDTEFSIEAGYHWFTQWGRDAMISLPGLTLYSGKETLCLQVLSYFAAHESLGMIPNRIAPLASGQDEFDSMDASLWFCWAVQQYYQKTTDLLGIQKHLWPTLKNIITYYQQGTRYDIKQAENGLLYGGNDSVKLTWMDVMIDGKPITPRTGAAVEINALWYNALCFVSMLAEALHDPLVDLLKSDILRVKESFSTVFWNPTSACLYDFVNDQESNGQIRPNQIIAAALPYSPLEAPMALAVINIVEEQLLTPYGLRTLSVTDVQYHGVYEGNQTQRDMAYHHGTVWPWLLGFFTDALLKFSSKEQAQKVLQPSLMALMQHVNADAGLGCISEIFDGNSPHQSRGCIQQAWSIAECIRMLELLQ